jgi:CHAD domain-containing protein
MDEHLAKLSINAFAHDRLQVLLGRVDQEWRRCTERSDADAVHDLRVSLRRFGETLRLFKILMPKTGWKQVRAERRQVMNLAGQARDVDIARETFVYSDIAIPPDLDNFLANERAIAEAALRASLAVGLATAFYQRWERALELTNTTEEDEERSHKRERSDAEPIQSAPSIESIWHTEETSAANAQLVLPGLLEEYCRKGQKLAIEGVRAARLHELRLGAKHLRYALEIFRPIYGRKMDELLVSLKESQTDLGEISDCTATIAWLKEKKIVRRREGQHLRSYLEHRAAKGATKFANYWRDHFGLPVFHDHWTRYLKVYAGRMPPAPRQQLPAVTTIANDQLAMPAILSQAAEISDNGVSQPYSGVRNPR